MAGSLLPTPGNKKRAANLRPKSVGEGPSKIQTVEGRQAAKPIRDRARALLEDPDYVKALQKRLIDGTAGAIEVWLYRYGYGDPKVDKADEEERKEEFERIRAEVQGLIKAGGKEAKILDISIQRSSRKLTRLAHPRDENGDT